MKIILRITIAILLLILLAACGGGEDSTAEQEPDSTTAEEIEQENESSTAEETNASEQAADDGAMDEPGAADDAQQDDAAAAEEQEASHDEDAESADHDDDGEAMEEGEEGEEMAEDSDGGEMMASGDGWGESGATAQSACDHPYMPLREGATWTYDSGEDSYSWEVTSVEGDMNEATANVLVTFEELTLAYEWDCAQGKGISSFDFAGQGMASSFPEMTMELTRAEGEFLPPAEVMEPGYSWTAEFDQTIDFLLGEGEGQIEASGEINTVQNSSVLSADPITAAGVTADGVQVEQISEIVTIMDMMGTAVEQGQTLNNKFEMGWGIGIMRQATESEFGPASIELISFFVP